jgi:Cof subfamily protein (haloacid dehalogenase superfamily)
MVHVEQPLLVATDIDGTLLTPTDEVTPRTAEVIGRVIAADVPFVLVTGRPPRWIPTPARRAGTTGLAVCANGAALYDIGADRVIWRRGLDPVLLSDLASTLDRALPGCALAVERVGDTAQESDFVAEFGYEHAWPEGPNQDESRAVVLGFEAVKMLVRHTSMTSAEMVAVCAEVLDDHVDVTYSTNLGLLELSARGVTKATGLADVAERFGVAREDVVAFGDMPNDVPMLSWAGHGVAMANAHPDAVEAADEVTAPNSEDGVALVLERWF